MQTTEMNPALAGLFSELVDGVSNPRAGFILNTGDAGLLRSLEKLSAADASRSANGGATIAAHAQHVRYGLSLMNQWATEGGNPFANAKWDEAWKLSTVDTASWDEIARASRTKRIAGWKHSGRRGMPVKSSSPASSPASRISPIISARSGRSRGRHAGRRRERSNRFQKSRQPQGRRQNAKGTITKYGRIFRSSAFLPCALCLLAVVFIRRWSGRRGRTAPTAPRCCSAPCSISTRRTQIV